MTGLPAERIGDLALRHGIAVHPRLLDRFARHLPGSGAAGSAVHEQLAQLTEREREVLAEVARGLSKLEIGQRLAVSEATVKSHVGRILTELALRDRVQVVVYADENGIIRPGD